MKATINDVAKEAGVSMKTVSRVLNNEPNVAKTTRERVMEVARTLKYAPNLAARGLASSRSYLLALLYDDPSPSYLTNLQRGVVSVCRVKGYHLVLEPISVTDLDEVDLEIRLRRLGVDGVILTPPLTDTEAVRNTLDRLDIPFVMVSSLGVTDQTSIGLDEVRAAYDMTSHLIEKGHRDIGFVIGHPNHAASKDRLDGFSKAMKDNDLIIHNEWVVQGDFKFASGVKAGETLLETSQPRPSAVFASNDDMAAGIMSVAGRLGLDIPGELSVCGFDNTPVSQIVWPQLTTIGQPIRRIGEMAAEHLMRRDGPSTSGPMEVDYRLIIRGSTGSPGRHD